MARVEPRVTEGELGCSSCVQWSDRIFSKAVNDHKHTFTSLPCPWSYGLPRNGFLCQFTSFFDSLVTERSTHRIPIFADRGGESESQVKD